MSLAFLFSRWLSRQKKLSPRLEGLASLFKSRLCEVDVAKGKKKLWRRQTASKPKNGNTNVLFSPQIRPYFWYLWRPFLELTAIPGISAPRSADRKRWRMKSEKQHSGSPQSLRKKENQKSAASQIWIFGLLCRKVRSATSLLVTESHSRS